MLQEKGSQGVKRYKQGLKEDLKKKLHFLSLVLFLCSKKELKKPDLFVCQLLFGGQRWSAHLSVWSGRDTSEGLSQCLNHCQAHYCYPICVSICQCICPFGWFCLRHQSNCHFVCVRILSITLASSLSLPIQLSVLFSVSHNL